MPDNFGLEAQQVNRSPIRIEQIDVKDIYEFACRTVDQAGPDDVLPITKHLALAFANNPYADEDDPCLLVAYVGDECAGYVGLYPGLLRTGDHLSKIFWGTTLYVDPEFRPHGVGTLLIKKLLAFDIDFVGAYATAESEVVWRRLGLVGQLGPRTDYVLRTYKLVGVVAKPLSIVKSLLGKLDFISRLNRKIHKLNNRVIYPALRTGYYSLILSFYRNALKTISVEEVEQIPENALNGASPRPPAEFHRGVEWINWQLRYRWFLGFDESDISYENYYFRGLRDQFKYVALEIYSSGEQRYEGFLVLSVSTEKGRTELTVLYFSPDLDARYIFLLALKYAKMYEAGSLVLPSQIRFQFEANILTRSFLYPKLDSYVCRPRNSESPLATSLEDIELDLCDGDGSFTGG